MRAFLLLLSVAAAARPDVAVVTDLKGDVQRQPEGAQFSQAALDEALALLDVLRTGVQSKTELRFVDRTLLAIGEKTRLRISLALFDVDRAPEEIRVALLMGHVDVDVARTAMQLVVQAESGQEVRLAPGRRARVRLVEGKLVIEALPEGFRFASDFDDDWWLPGADDGLFGPGIGPGSRPAGEADPLDIPGTLEPFSDDEGTLQETGADVTLRPRSP